MNNTMAFIRSFAAYLLTIMCFISINAHASEGRNITTDPKNNPIDEVVVTARKKVEKLQEVPISVSVIGKDQIQDLVIDDLQDLSLYVPGLQQQVLPLTSRLILRGVTSGDNNAFEQAVGTYVDGIYRGRMNQQHAGLFDMERIEVLHGPQVALYGNSSIGGAISMTTVKPYIDPDAPPSVDISYQHEFEYDEDLINLGINIPLSDTIAFRVAGKWRDQQEGISENLFSGKKEPTSKDEAFRISGLWLASDRLTIDARYEQGVFDLQGNAFDIYKHVDGSGNPFPGSTFTGVNDSILDVGNAAPFKYQKTFWQLDTDEALINAEYEFDSITLTSLTGYSHYRFEQSMDVDISPATLINTYQNENYRQFSQEIRITGEVESGLQYLAGIYYQKDTFDNDYFADFNTPLLVAAAFSLSPSDAERLISPFSRHILLEQDTAQWAAFGNVNIPLTNQLTGSLGYRYLTIKKEGLQAVRAADINHQNGSGDLVDIRYLSDPTLLQDADYLSDPTGYSVSTPVLVPDYTAGYAIVSAGRGVYHEFDDLQRKEHHSMFQAALSYQWDVNLMSYLSWSNGSKAGGFDFLYEKDNRNDVVYDDEEARVFEMGFKKNWQKFQLNMALFYGKYDDLQVSVFDGGIGFTVGNAASSTSKGLDTQIIWQPIKQFRTLVLFEYLDFTYNDFSSSTCHTTDRLNTGKTLCDASGDETPFVPKAEGVIAFEYESPITDSLKMQHLLSWRYKGKHTTASDNEPQTQQSAYEIVDYRFDLSPTDEQWQLSLIINNLFDKEYLVFTSVIPLAPGAAFANIIPKGREIALAFRYHH